MDIQWGYNGDIMVIHAKNWRTDQLVVSWLNGDIITKKEGYSYSGMFKSFFLIMGW